MDSSDNRTLVFQGRLGRTTKTSTLVTSDAGPAFPASIYTSVNISENPELEEPLFAGTLNEVECPYQPGRVYKLAVPLIYHDANRRVFALVLSDGLRHEELQRRSALLADLAKERDTLPEYVRHFHTVFEPEAVRHLGSDASSPLGATGQNRQPDTPRVSEPERKIERQKLELERIDVEQMRAQVEREQQNLHEQRQALEEEQRQLKAEQLKVEQTRLQLEQGPTSVERTEVVTDDQFLEVVAGDEDLDGAQIVDASSIVSEASLGSIEGLPTQWNALNASDDRDIRLKKGDVIASVRMDEERIQRLLDGAPMLFVQFHEIAQYPVIDLLLARLDGGQAPQEYALWPLDIRNSGHRAILDQLRRKLRVRFAFYTLDGELFDAITTETPLEPNVRWAIEKADAEIRRSVPSPTAFERARREVCSEDFEVLGTMRHNFHRDSFSDIDSPAAAKLAAGIVGYWSSDDVYDYLIGNRSFSYRDFSAIQTRVVAKALDYGIYLNEPLRRIAVDERLVRDDEDLVRTLTANFAEVCVGLRQNDLNQLDQWDNWDALLNLADDLRVELDDDVVELAQASYRRAQELQDNPAPAGDSSREDSHNIPDTLAESLDDLVISRHSEATGMVYFLPDADVVDTFDDLADMDKPDLERLLDDAHGRLEAAQMLVERFGSRALPAVFGKVDQMTVLEVAALAKFFETKASYFEDELVRWLKESNSSGAYIAAHALSSIKSPRAMILVYEALQDPRRRGNGRALIEALCRYQSSLVPFLTRTIKRDGLNDDLVWILVQLEHAHSGVLDELARDRNKVIREAARRARIEVPSAS